MLNTFCPRWARSKIGLLDIPPFPESILPQVCPRQNRQLMFALRLALCINADCILPQEGPGQIIGLGYNHTVPGSILPQVSPGQNRRLLFAFRLVFCINVEYFLPQVVVVVVWASLGAGLVVSRHTAPALPGANRTGMQGGCLPARR